MPEFSGGPAAVVLDRIPVMPGPSRAAAPSLRPAVDAVLPPLPRRVLRHLVVATRLGVGSRVVVGGDAARPVAALFARLGIETETADVARLADGAFDAAVWLELGPATVGERSLASAAALGRTARLLSAVRSAGVFVVAMRTGRTGEGHEPSCLERHLAAFPGPAETVFFADRLLGGWLRAARAGYAVAAWRAPSGAVEPGLWRRRATGPGSRACCEWAAVGVRERKAA